MSPENKLGIFVQKAECATVNDLVYYTGFPFSTYKSFFFFFPPPAELLKFPFFWQLLQVYHGTWIVLLKR